MYILKSLTHIEGDNINVMSKLSLRGMDYSLLGHILEEIKTLVADLRNNYF